jgi:uncharacterized integral membrane protein
MNLFYKFLDFKRTPYIIAGVIFLCSLVVLSCFKSAESQLTVLNQAVKFNTMMVKSSDDLTNYARYFVTTKDEHWRNEFDNVLKVRNGDVADKQGVKKSFQARLKEVQFTQEELDMLLKAEQLSNNLAKIEVQAFELISSAKSGDWDFITQSQKNTQAQVLMFGHDYKSYKQQIITTSNEFYAMVVNRLQSQYQFYMTTAWTMIIVINLSLILLVIAVNHKSTAVTTTPKRPVRKTPAAKKVAKKVARKIK